MMVQITGSMRFSNLLYLTRGSALRGRQSLGGGDCAKNSSHKSTCQNGILRRVRDTGPKIPLNRFINEFQHIGTLSLPLIPHLGGYHSDSGPAED